MARRRARAPANLRFANNVYHWRLRVPDDLRGIIGKAEYVRTTKTGDLLQAQAKSVPWTLEAKENFERLRRRQEATADDVTAVARRVLQDGLADLPKPAPGEDADDWSIMIDTERDGWASVLDPRGRFPDPWPFDEALEIVRAAGFTIRANSALADQAAGKIARARLQVLAIAEARAAGDYALETWDDLGDGGRIPGPAPSPAYRGSRPPSPVLSETFDAYLAEGARKWAAKTVADYRMARTVALSILGDLPVGDVTRAHVKDIRDVALALPANWRTAPQYRNRAPKAIVADKPPGPTLNPATVTHYLVGLSGALEYAKDEGWIDINVAHGLAHVANPTPVRHRRREWTVDMLNIWFGQDIYSDAPSAWTHRHWIPLIALYSGLRLEEIARLRVDDVRETDGVLAIHIEWREGEPLKTRSSERIVPVHDELIRVGLREYIERIAGGSDRLWPALRKSKLGKWGGAYSQSFGRARRRLGLVDRLVPFAALRSTFSTNLVNADVSPDRVGELMGHAPRGVTMQSYVKRVDLQLLKADLDKLQYVGLRLDHMGPAR